jgi:hypothetical protein
MMMMIIGCDNNRICCPQSSTEIITGTSQWVRLLLKDLATSAQDYEGCVARMSRIPIANLDDGP